MNKTFAALLCIGTLLVLPNCGQKETVEAKNEATEVVVRSAVTKEVIEQA